MVAFSSTTHQYPYIERYARDLKEARPGLVSVIGGTHPTLVPEEVSACPAFDAVCVGEGEYPLRDLVERLDQGRDYADVQNLWVRRGDEVIRNPMRPLIADLDELPYVDRDLFDYEQMLAENDGWVDIMSGRGCPYNCSYCCNPGLKKRYHGLGRYVRFRSVEHIMGELAPAARPLPRALRRQDGQLSGRYLYAGSGLGAGLLPRLRERVQLSLLDQHARREHPRRGVGARAGRGALRRHSRGRGERRRAFARYGAQAPHEQRPDHRGLSPGAALRAEGLYLQHDRHPRRDAPSIQATIDLNRALAPDEFQFSVFYPYPMTELHDTCVAQGLIKPGAQQTSYYSLAACCNCPR